MSTKEALALGQNIKNYRKNGPKGRLRQSEVARLTGLKQPNLSRIENGLVWPRQATIEKIARAFGIDASLLTKLPIEQITDEQQAMGRNDTARLVVWIADKIRAGFLKEFSFNDFEFLVRFEIKHGKPEGWTKDFLPKKYHHILNDVAC